MSAHTAGPWEAFGDEIIASDSDVCVADVPLHDGMDPTEWQANVHLIAAAPDLLAALKHAVETIRIFHGLEMVKSAEQELWALYQASPEMQQINAALKKAEAT